MSKYRFQCEGWTYEESFYVCALSLYEAVSVFEDTAKHNFWNYKKFSVEIMD